MTPEQLLDTADHLLAAPPASMRGCWQRACATLIRAALEEVLDGVWRDARWAARGAATIAGRPMRHQLLALPFFVKDGEAVATARAAWQGLSRAMHHHTYELPPTAAELRGWYEGVSGLLAVVASGDNRPATPHPRSPRDPAVPADRPVESG